MIPLQQSWPVASRPRPIVSIGAGAIVRTAHLPAYRRLGYHVVGVFDVRQDTAASLARDFAIPTVYRTMEEATRIANAVFDVAVPGDQITDILERLPDGAPVLIQKPMGDNLGAARQILEICTRRRLVAALNFQLRFSPNVLALHHLVTAGSLGDIVDIEVRVVVRQPWENWPFLRGASRLEVLYHSVHYLDTIRHLAGEPAGVLCRAVGHPGLPEFADARSTIILDYGNGLRCSLLLNHTHGFGPEHRASMLKVEGTRGAAVLTMGVNLDYPDGGPDALQVTSDARGWRDVPLRGSWFTEAFEGPMSNLQRVATGEDPVLVSPVSDALRTMALVEACYQSSAAGGVKPEA